MRLFAALTFLSWWLLTSPCGALEPRKAITQYKADNWQASQGLTQTSVTVLLQTRDGYIWLGTQRGLVRFDGIRFTVFNKENTPGLEDNAIKALLEDPADGLWIGTDQGGLFLLKDREVTRYPTERYPALLRITSLYCDRGGHLWIGTLNHGLTHLSNGTLTTFTKKNGLTSNRVRSFHEDQSGRLWIATGSGLTIREPGAQSRFTPYTPGTGSFDNHIISITETTNGELWLGCVWSLYRLKNNKIIRFEPVDRLSRPVIKCLYQDRDGSLWAGTDGSGLIRISIRDNTMETYTTRDGLPSDYVYSLLEDREGSLWVGTLTGGLQRLRDTTVTPYSTEEGLAHDRVNSIFEGKDGSLWVGTKKGVSRLKDGKCVPAFTPGQKFGAPATSKIIETTTGELWAGTDAGLKRLKNGTFKTFTNRDGLTRGRVLYLLEDKNNRVWASTSTTPHRLYNGRFIPLDISKEPFPKKISCMFEDRDGNIWFGTSGKGLYRFSDGAFTRYYTENGLVNDQIECIHQDSQGILYFGTRGGFSRMDGETFTNYTTRDGLIDNFIRNIMEDNNGCLWLSTQVGIARIDKNDLENHAGSRSGKIPQQVFDESHGMRNVYCRSGGAKTRDGKLWFATYKGIAMIDPDHIKTNTHPPPVLIEEVKTDGDIIDIKGETGSPVFPPGTKRLEIHYTGISFILSRKLTFKIKLEGYDSGWVDAGSQRSITYTGLPPGRYTFRVAARNSDGIWNLDGASFPFRLKPYWFNTPAAFIAYILSFLLAVFILVRWRSWKLVREKKRLEQLVKVRAKEIYQKNLLLEEQSVKLREMDRVKSRFFANISHEFRTPLTLIMGPLEQVLEDPGNAEMEENVNMALRSSQRLLALINQLLDLSRLDSGTLQLRAVKANIIPLLEGLVGSFQSLTDQKKLELTFTADPEDITLWFDAEKLEKIVINLVANAVKFTPGGGRISVAASTPDTPCKSYPRGCLEITVSDTGCGIPQDQLPHIFNRFYQAENAGGSHRSGTGIGLALVQELVTLHHGDIRVKSIYRQGTEFRVRLPLGKDHLHPGELAQKDETQPTPPSILKTGPVAQLTEPLEADTPGEHRNSEKSAGQNKNDTKDIVLVVDDNPDVRKYIRSPLEKDYRIVEAVDGKEGLAKARKSIPDLIISDVMMPGMDGFQLCSALKKDVRTSHIPIILLTAKAGEENIIAGLETGADDYITKPFNAKVLLARIKNLIDLRLQLQEKVRRSNLLQPAEIQVTSVDREFMKELQAAIEKNMSDPEFGVDKLTEVLYLSRATLNRKIRAISGQSTNQLIQSYRLKRAAQLLKANFGNVTEVAFEVGFSNSAYFSKCFREKFHQPPHTYQSSLAGD